MRLSANLNVIVKAIQRATAHAPRDFIELENLQSNSLSANKFAAACYNRIKQILADDFSKFRPDYNLIFSDGQKIIRSQNAEYTYIIHAIDGFENLARSNPDFTVAVALEHQNLQGQKEAISVAIIKIFGNETYYCEKGFGAFLNNRRIRVSKRLGISETFLASTQNYAALEQKMTGKKFAIRAYGCNTLDLAYLSAARLEMALFEKTNFEFYQPFLLLVREAGGKITEDEKFILASN
jgi:myo-inositol-1(or 4)-monophosphatase